MTDSLCGDGFVDPVDRAHHNPPGLAEIDYRIGTYASFRRSMLESIAGQEELQAWTARRSEDFGIAFLEMWAYVADILAFYQERIANEAFLRTARHEDSVRRLAARLDYHPAPGRAAEALLAFTLEEGATARIPPRLRVQSVPAQDEKPVKFETVAEIAASAALNAAAVFPEPREEQLFAPRGNTATLAPSEAVQIREATSTGASFLLWDTENHRIEEKTVAAFEERADGRIDLTWDPPVRGRTAGPDDGREPLEAVRAFRYTGVLRVLGYGAPEESVKVEEETSGPPGVTTTLEKLEESDFSFSVDPDAERPTIHLDAVHDDLKPGERILIVDPSSPNAVLATVDAVTERPIAKISVEDSNGSISEELRRALGDQGSVTKLDLSFPPDSGAGEMIEDADRRSVRIYRLAGPEITFWGLEPGSADEGLRMPARVGPKTPEEREDRFRALSPDPGVADATVRSLEGRTVMIVQDGRTEPCTVVEAARTRRPADGEGPGVPYLELTLAPVGEAPFSEGPFTAGRAVLRGNVAPATHGVTVADEVLGAGDATEAFQTFELGEAPVTHVPDPEAAHGVASTLEVRVDGIRWEETRRLYGHDGDDRVYTTRVGPDGTRRVRFGDGVRGARPTTGHDNVTATYRKGQGPAGNLEAGRLETLLDRPQGVSEVTNPRPATGGAEGEGREAVRENAPGSVRTFHRVVSLRDFEDVARQYTGVARARAHPDWRGTRRTVRLVVVGDEGERASPNLRRDLKAHLDERRDPHRALEISPHRRAPVSVAMTVRPHPAHRTEDVLAAAEAAVADFFAFENRTLGQSVNRSDLYRAVQEAKGVVGARIDRLRAAVSRGGTPRSLAPGDLGRIPLEPDELAALAEGEPTLTLGPISSP